MNQQGYSGERGGGRREGGRGDSASKGLNEEKELASKPLRIQNKRFYVDVKENTRGKFIKISELSKWNRRSRIQLTMSCASELRDRLSEFADICARLPPSETERGSKRTNSGGDSATGKDQQTNNSNKSAPGQQRRAQPPGQQPYVEERIHSESIVRDARRYYLDLKENSRGRFLRITLSTQVNRSQVAIPEPGIVELRDTLEVLVSEFASPEDLQEGEDSQKILMESQNLRADRRIFYFDVNSNRRGLLLRVSEVQSAYRTAIVIPDRSWAKFRDVMDDYVKKLEEHNNSKNSETSPSSSTKEDAKKVPTTAKAGAQKTTAAMTSPPKNAGEKSPAPASTAKSPNEKPSATGTPRKKNASGSEKSGTAAGASKTVSEKNGAATTVSKGGKEKIDGAATVSKGGKEKIDGAATVSKGDKEKIDGATTVSTGDKEKIDGKATDSAAKPVVVGSEDTALNAAVAEE